MKRIYTIGKIILDVIFDQDMRANCSNVGGAGLTTTLGIQRLGGDVAFVSCIANDKVGIIFEKYLAEEQLSMELIEKVDGTSLVALAFHANASAQYEFLGSAPNCLQLAHTASKIPDDSIICFGDYFSMTSEYDSVLQVLQNKKCLKFFDPNIRSGVGPLLFKCIQACDILRLSSDDYEAIGKSHQFETQQTFVAYANKCLIIVTDADGANVYINQRLTRVNVQRINPVNTIGAGDSFNSGFLRSLQHLLLDHNFQDITDEQWIKCVKNGIKCAQAVCMSDEPRLPPGFQIDL